MERTSLPTEIIMSQSRSTLGHWHLDWNPQPGVYIELDGQTYLVLERQHRYRLVSGRYQIYHVSLYVQTSHIPGERSLMKGCWVIGDVTCRYNAQSEVVRCAVNPMGPCNRCCHYQPRQGN